MIFSNIIFSYIDEAQSNASSLSSAVEQARSDWDDGCYESIAAFTADRILSDANSFCGSVRSDAQMVYTDMMSIETIINDL